MPVTEFEVFFPESESTHELERRKGGGGGGRGGGSSRPMSGGGSSGGRSSTTYGNGGGPIADIPGGAPFAGRTQGGGTRGNIYGTPYYGSGYPGTPNHNRGTTGMPFPFYYWPLGFGVAAGGGYIYHSEYGNPDNDTRPGGPQMIASFSSDSSNTTLHLIADRDTVEDLIPIIREGCTGLNSNSSTNPSSYDTNNNNTKPESALQFYRASSIALLLEGYNNTAALGDDENAPPTPFPDWRNQDLIRCLNDTIGEAAPLVDAGSVIWAPSGFGLVGLVFVVCRLASLV
ncbi:hypothetical protein BDV98DRAFT_576319 [Pterulicium gracile]|uniref:Uncharacterized protein n=1 Tax=Pterulicium gracile TaxID=1884261 RepID=A0A5C3Q3F8_9AGAR|nr:hypothetical protein BDV98DRAFT_576319 [Pterula gracilis]